MAENRRMLRVEKEIKQIAAATVTNHAMAELTGFASVTRAEVSKDLRYAKVFVSLMNSENQDDDMQVIQAVAPEVQAQLNRHLRLKYCPKVRFYQDNGLIMYLKWRHYLGKLFRT